MTRLGSRPRPVSRPGPVAAGWLRRPWPGSTPGLLAGLLVVALLHAQWLGQWHHVVHAGIPQGAAVATAALAQAAPDVFGHGADDERGCRLFDHLGTADGLPSAPLVCLPQVLPMAADAAVAAEAQGRVLRPYQARAPPQG